MDLLIIVVLSLLLAPLALFTSGAARIVLGLAFVLFFPGYNLIAVLFPGKNDLSGVIRLALSFGLSIVVTSLMGLALNYTPWGLYLQSLLITLMVFILISAAVAWLRRQKLQHTERFKIPVLSFISILICSKSCKRDRVLSTLLLIAILGLVTSAVFAIAKPTDGEEFTEFYILGLEGEAAHYPEELVLGEEAKVIIGIVNQESSTTDYKVKININGRVVVDTESITLEQGKMWEKEIAFTAAAPGSNQKVEFQLYKNTIPTPYRSLNLWIDVSEVP